MSLVLNVVLKFDENIDLVTISNECFNYVVKACNRKIAINKILRFDECRYLEPTELLLDLSNSYIFQEAEEILRDDHTIPNPSHIVRLKNLQGLLSELFYSPFVKELGVYMFTDGSKKEDFKAIECNLKDFALVMKEKLYQQISYAYKCVFVKVDI